VGLGKVDRILRLDVEWPGSRTKQTFSNVPVNQRIVVTEGEASYRRIGL
jgi:hypothetical protein